MYVRFTQDYLSYPKGRVCTLTPSSVGEALINKGVAEKATKEVFDKYEKERIALEKKCEECKKPGSRPCEECEGGKDAKPLTAK